MRQIKFRVWDAEECVWRQGCSISQNGEVESSWGKTKNWVVQQFTTLQDSDGRDIYEGDILETCKCFQEKKWIGMFYSSGYELSEPKTQKWIETVDFGIIDGDMNDDCLGWVVGGNGYQHSLLGHLLFCKSIPETAYSKVISMTVRVIGNIFENPELLS